MSVASAARDLRCSTAASLDLGALGEGRIAGNLPHFEFSASAAPTVRCIDHNDQVLGLTALVSESGRFKQVLIPKKDRLGNQTGVRVQWYDRETRRFCKAPTEEQFIQSLAVPIIPIITTSSLAADDLAAASLPRISRISAHLAASCSDRSLRSSTIESASSSSPTRSEPSQVVEWTRRPESIPSIATPPSLVRAVERLGEALLGRSTIRVLKNGVYDLVFGMAISSSATYGRPFFGGRIHLEESNAKSLTSSERTGSVASTSEGLVPRLLSRVLNPLMTLARTAGANSRSLFERVATKPIRKAVYSELFNNAALSKRCFGEPVLGLKLE